MGWLTDALETLQQDGIVKVRPTGGSMRGRIESGQLVTLQATDGSDARVDDVVLVRWHRSHILHLVKAEQDDRLLIGNNIGRINGWVDRSDVVARVIAVED